MQVQKEEFFSASVCEVVLSRETLRTFVNFLKSLNKLVSEANIRFNADGMKIHAIDQTKTVSLLFHAPVSEIATYRVVSGEHVFPINVYLLAKIVKKYSKDENLLIKFHPNGDILKFHYYKTEFFLKVLTSSEGIIDKEYDFGRINLSNKFTISGVELKRLRELDSFERVNFSITSDALMITCEDSLGELDASTYIPTRPIAGDGGPLGVFSRKYLLALAEFFDAKTKDTAYISMDIESPLIITNEKPARVAFALAPLDDDDDDDKTFESNDDIDDEFTKLDEFAADDDVSSGGSIPNAPETTNHPTDSSSLDDDDLEEINEALDDSEQTKS